MNGLSSRFLSSSFVIFVGLAGAVCTVVLTWPTAAEAEVGAASQPLAALPIVDEVVPSHVHDVGDAYFTCPMHPAIHAHEPGRCPLCKMRLTSAVVKNGEEGRWKAAASQNPPPADPKKKPATKAKPKTATKAKAKAKAPTTSVAPAKQTSSPPPIQVAPAPTASAEGDDEIAFYTCPMHPSVKEAEPGSCPICGMDLTPVTKAAHESGVVIVDSVRRQALGIRVTTAERKKVEKTVRAPGTVEVDETRIVDVSLQTHGWIEGLRVKETGQFVKRGQRLANLYSPTVVAAQDELIVAAQAIETATTDAAKARAQTLLRGARGKLSSLGLAAWQIDNVLSTKKTQRTFALVAPTSGYVVEKDVVEGAHVQGGARLFRIVSLDRVWIDVSVYARDLPLIDIGQKVTASASTGSEHEGTIDYIYPDVSPRTQTARLRVEVDNADTLLRPGMFVDARVHVALEGERLMVPSEAVVHTGTTRLLFVDAGEGRLLPTLVKTGVRTADEIEIVGGLEAGTVVVASGTFLIASESRLRSAAAYWGRHAGDNDDASASAGTAQMEAGHAHH